MTKYGAISRYRGTIRRVVLREESYQEGTFQPRVRETLVCGHYVLAPSGPARPHRYCVQCPIVRKAGPVQTRVVDNPTGKPHDEETVAAIKEILGEAATADSDVEICRKYGISQELFGRWKRRYGRP